MKAYTYSFLIQMIIEVTLANKYALYGMAFLCFETEDGLSCHVNFRNDTLKRKQNFPV